MSQCETFLNVSLKRQSSLESEIKESRLAFPNVFLILKRHEEWEPKLKMIGDGNKLDDRTLNLSTATWRLFYRRQFLSSTNQCTQQMTNHFHLFRVDTHIQHRYALKLN